MMIRRWIRKAPLLIALSFGVGSFATVVDAQPGKEKREKRREKRQEKREDRKEKREEIREKRKENREERRENRKERRAERRKACDANPECKTRRDAAKKRWEEKKDEVKAARKEWRDKRPERRKKRREFIKKNWGKLIGHPAARQELRLHARRMARLNRAKFVAEQVEDAEAVKKADELIAKEKARHQARMAELKEKHGGGE